MCVLSRFFFELLSHGQTGTYVSRRNSARILIRPTRGHLKSESWEKKGLKGVEVVAFIHWSTYSTKSWIFSSLKISYNQRTYILHVHAYIIARNRPKVVHVIIVILFEAYAGNEHGWFVWSVNLMGIMQNAVPLYVTSDTVGLSNYNFTLRCNWIIIDVEWTLSDTLHVTYQIN